ncbi:MAG: thioesterase family protein [Caulobacteraceae bacterium]
MKMPELKPGMSSSIQKVITKKDTALNFGSGALTSLLATPTLAALMIDAAVKTIDPLLPDGIITIGKSLKVEHVKPTLEGMTVTVNAKLIEVNCTRMLFEITAYDEAGQIGTGYHERYLVNYNKLMDNVNERCGVVQGISGDC